MLQCHGTEDPVIYYKWGMIMHELYKSINSKYEFKSYEGLMHAVNDQVRVVRVIINTLLLSIIEKHFKNKSNNDIKIYKKKKKH